MNILFDNLESLIDAQNGIEKARELILQLAVQGKLTEQDAEDEPVSELLKKFKKEKESLIAEGKIKKQNGLPPIKDLEKPFELPKGWDWVRLDQLGETQTGTTPPTKDPNNYGNFIPFIGPGDILDWEINYTKNALSESGLKKGRLIKANSILMVCIGGSIGKCAINKIDVTCNQQINTITPFAKVNQNYLFYAMNAPYFRLSIIKNASGSATPIINKEKWINLSIPLPPFDEQKRIAEKVNSLMALLDELEEKRERRNQKRLKLNNASLEKLLTSKDDKEQKTNWNRIEENFSTLYSVPENVEKLKQAILQLAVQGKLVKQDPKDEPASELLKKINSSKLKFVKENKIRTPQKKLINSLLTELAVPSSWEIVRVDDIINFITDFQANGSFASLRENVKYYSNEDFAVLVRLKDLRHDLKKSTDFVYTDKHGYEFLIKSSLTGGEILVANVGAGVGTTLVMPVINRKATLAPNMFKVILNDFIDKNYFLYFADSPLYWDWLNSFMKATAQPKMNKSEYASIIFPLPPLAEQKRIVEKVNELMSLCNALEEKLTKKEATAEKLVGAVVNAIANKSSGK